MPSPETTIEKHYRVNDVAKILSVGRETARRIFKDEPGVIKIRQGRKAAHTTYSIPESVVRRVLTRLAS